MRKFIVNLSLILIFLGVNSTLLAPTRLARDIARELHENNLQYRFNKFNKDLKQEYPELFILAMRESARTDRGDTIPNYAAYNRYGYIGAWQINIKYLPSYGIHYLTLDAFKEDPDLFPPELQLLVIKKMTAKNMQHLEPYFKYIGKEYRGVQITAEGMMFAAHLAGAGGTQRFFRYGHDPADSNGTRLSHYLDYQNTFHYFID